MRAVVLVVVLLVKIAIVIPVLVFRGGRRRRRSCRRCYLHCVVTAVIVITSDSKVSLSWYYSCMLTITAFFVVINKTVVEGTRTNNTCTGSIRDATAVVVALLIFSAGA